VYLSKALEKREVQKGNLPWFKPYRSPKGIMNDLLPIRKSAPVMLISDKFLSKRLDSFLEIFKRRIFFSRHEIT